MPSLRALLASVLATLALVLSACSGPSRPNVLLITIDTLRADHLGAYGAGDGKTPNLDALARKGVLFEDTLSPVPLTLPAHSSLMTGTLPPFHGLHDNLGGGLPDDQTTLAESLKEKGYRTGAVISSFVLDRQFNLSQGFDTYEDEFEEEHRIAFLAERKGDETTRVALRWLEANKDENFFLFVHYYDPHDDYEPPPPFDARFSDDPYSGEVAFADQQVGRLLDRVAALGLEDETLIVVTSDHGEMLGEHGESTHGYFVYQSALHVPLIIKMPGIAPGVVDERVGLIDVAPTIASLVGASLPASSGTDLSEVMRDTTLQLGRRELYAESLTAQLYLTAQGFRGVSGLFSLVTDRWKYIDTVRPELYDLVEDPGETSNVVADHPEVVGGMKGRLAEILSEPTSSAEQLQLDDDALRRLSALGYMTSGSDSPELVLDGGQEDPKDWIEFYSAHQRLEKLVNEGDFDEATRVAERLLEDKPDFAAAYFQLAQIAANTGDLELAATQYRRGLEHDPDNKAAHFNLAENLRVLGRTEDAITHYRETLRIDPGFADAKSALGQILLDRGDVDQGATLLSEASRETPDSPDARVRMGVAEAARGRLEAAESELRRALELDPSHVTAHLQLGNVLFQRGRREEAVTHYERVLELAPSSAEAHYRLSVALRALNPNNAAEGERHLQKAVELDPTLAEAQNDLGRLLASRGQVSAAMAHFRTAVEARPRFAEARNNLGLALHMTGSPEQAIPHFRVALEERPDWTEPMNELAWILATNPSSKLRAPAEAVRLAERAASLTGRRQPVVLDTLAAAYAAAGNFPAAVETGEQAVALAARTDARLASEMRTRLELYKQGRAFVSG